MSHSILKSLAVGLTFTLTACGGCDDPATNNGADSGGPSGGDDIGNFWPDARLPDGGVIGGGDGGTGTDGGGGGGDMAGTDMGGVCETVQCATECCAAGEECVGDVCMPACAGTRCGATSELCCEGAEVCIFDGCLVPGQGCQSSFECPDGQYCEPILGSCIPKDVINVDCEYRPPIGQFTPSPEQHFPGVTRAGELFSGSLAAPAVADVDADGMPEVVAQMYRGALGGGMLVVLNGEDFSLAADGGVNEVVANAAGVAVGNIDVSTPELEIVALANGGGVAMYAIDTATQTLNRVWHANQGALANISSEGAPSLADLDGDGVPEIIVGFSVVDANGQIWNGVNNGPAGTQLSNGSMTAVVDIDRALDQNGAMHPEIVAGNRVMNLDGTMLWDQSGTYSDGYPAVADLDIDGTPEIASTSAGNLQVFSHDGTLVFGPIPLPGGGQGGPPTIADFDGDGRREIAAAGQGQYTVFDPDCTGATPDLTYCPTGGDGEGILWTVAVQDLSSSRTGSSVFDFDGDGKAEVVYNDECFLRVFDGTNGAVLFETANSTRTGSEMPIVVDVDADFNAEIVVVGNNDQIARDNCETNFQNYPVGGTSGVFVFGDANDNWVTTRRVWNQHPFHITNVQDNGSIPASEIVHYLGGVTNSFRLNVQPDGQFNAPDLVVEQVDIRNPTCGENVTVEIAVTVSNDGSLGVGPGAEVVITATNNGDTRDVATIATTQALLPSQSETILVTFTLPAGWTGADFTVNGVVDPDGSINECLEDNNSGSGVSNAGNRTFDDLYIANLTVNDSNCGTAGTVTIDLTVQNDGGSNVPGNLPIVVEALRGTSVVPIDTVRTSSALQRNGDTESFSINWTAPPTIIGTQFEVRATIDPNGEVTACSTDFELAPAECIPPQ